MRHKFLRLIARVKESPAWVGEMFEHRIREFARRHEPALLKSGLVEREQALDEIRVILQESADTHIAILPGAQSPRA